MDDEQQEEAEGATRKKEERRAGYTIRKRERTRFWEVIDPAGELVCLAAYRRGAREVVRRLSAGRKGR